MSDVSRSSEDSSDEEEILYNLLNFELRKIPKNEGYIENTVPLYNDKEFMEHFRISKDLVDQISERFLTSNFFKINSYGPNDKITAKAHILIFLWFAGHQTSSFRDVADRFDISISSLYRIIRRVTNFLSNMSGEVIRWPTNEEKNNIEQYFRESSFPGVVGIIDGSHIKIDKPKEDPDSYINRKKFFSIQKLNDVNEKTGITDNEDIKVNKLTKESRHKTNYTSDIGFSYTLKLESLRSKINSSLEEINKLWDIAPVIDGDDDLQKRKRRAVEFTSRFSRNYLYNLGMQIKEIRRMLRNTSPRFCLKLHSGIFQKLFKAQNIISQGLRAYCKHMPTSIPGGLPNKLNQLLKHSCDLWRICKRNETLKSLLYTSTGSNTFIEDIEDKCNKIMQKIQQNAEKEKLNEIKTNVSAPTITKKLQKVKKLNKKNKLSHRLSMYTMETSKYHSQIWKRNFIHLTSSNSTVKSKLKRNSKREGIKGESKTDMPVGIINQNISQESISLKKKKSEIIIIPPKEDEIITQMDILNQRESDIVQDGTETNEKESIIKHFTELEPDLSKNEFNHSLRQLLIEILQNIDNQDDKETEKSSMVELKNVLTEIKQCTQKQNEKETRSKPKEERCKITVTGPKNAKLICLSPAQSEDNVENLPETIIHQSIGTNTSNINVSVNPQIRQKQKIASLRLERLGNISPQKDMRSVKKQIIKINMPRSIIRNINKYKDFFAQYTRKDNMYIVRKNKKPWEIVSKIADGLLDTMISNVLEELEIDQLLIKLYEMELK